MVKNGQKTRDVINERSLKSLFAEFIMGEIKNALLPQRRLLCMQDGLISMNKYKMDINLEGFIN